MRFRKLIAPVLLGLLGSSTAFGVPGLVGEYFNEARSIKAVQETRREAFLIRNDAQINFPVVNGEFYGSHLFTGFGVRWSGMIHVDSPGKYVFHMAADDGGQLSINEKVVIAYAKAKPMLDKTREVSFEKPGDFPIQVLLWQAGGGAGCVLKWQAPGADQPVVMPAEVFSHDAELENKKWDKDKWELFGRDHQAYLKKYGQPYEKMDYGPFLSGSFKAAEPAGNTTNKGIIVSLNKEHTINILFDTEMCRYSAGWTGDYIDFHGVAYDGQHGYVPSIKGTQIFGSPNMPGWEHEGSFKDPRKTAYGDLPADWIKWRGLYRSGDQTILSYTVNGIGVLDLPGWNNVGLGEFSRTLQIEPSSKPITMMIGSNPTGNDNVARSVYTAAYASAGVTLSPFGTNPMVATFPPHDSATQYKVVIYSSVDNSSHEHVISQPKIDFDSLIKGGPSHWGEPIVTQGKLGTTDGPYVVDTITAPEKNPADAWMRFGGFDFFPDGKSAAICTWNGDVWIVKGIDDKLDHLTWTRFASGLFQTLGLKIVNNEIYVLGRDQITKLHDLNGDGEADWYENFNNDCQISDGFHEFAHDLQVDSKGNFFYAKGGPVNPGGRGFQTLTDDAGCIMEVSADGKHSQVYATGLRAPNGMSMGPNDQMTVSDNQGTWLPACRISFVTKGSYLGVPSTSHLTPPPTHYGNPICWFPYVDGDYTQGDNSSGGAAWDESDKWGPLQGRLIHLSYGTCSIFETVFENVEGVWQGGVIRFPLDFDSGIMRARFNPVDGQLYVCGLKGWQTRAAKDGIFQRVRFTGKPVHMPNELHVEKDGLAISFTSPVDPVSAVDPDNYDIEEWNYIFSEDYGSPDMSVKDPKKKGHDTVDIESITLSADKKTIFIHIGDLKPVMQMKTIMKIKAADGSAMNWELDNTINIVPGQKAIAVVQPTGH